MPRLVEEELVGYGFGLAVGERQRFDKGMPVFNASGEPQTEPIWIMVFEQTGSETKHVVKITFNREGRDKLIEALTGVTVASRLPQEGAIEL